MEVSDSILEMVEILVDTRAALKKARCRGNGELWPPGVQGLVDLSPWHSSVRLTSKKEGDWRLFLLSIRFCSYGIKAQLHTSAFPYLFAGREDVWVVKRVIKLRYLMLIYQSAN
jgi:hypothetical protein